MTNIRNLLDWLFKDLNGRNGKYIIAEAPNVPLIAFIVCIVLAVVVYPGFFQTLCAVIAFIALTYWSYGEARSGRSRFRKIIGYFGGLAVIGAVLMWFVV